MRGVRGLTRSDDLGEAQFLALGGEFPEQQCVLLLDLPDVPPERSEGDEHPGSLVRRVKHSLSAYDGVQQLVVFRR